MKPDIQWLAEPGTAPVATSAQRGSNVTTLKPTTAADPAFEADVLDGLDDDQKHIPSIWLYDRRGSELFEEITEVAEYYPTRTETRLLAGLAPELESDIVGVHSLVEIGSGSSRKTRLLLAAMHSLDRYVPVDISADFLHDAATGLARDFPHLAIQPVVADFTQPFPLPAASAGRAGDDSAGNLGFFPGSTIGNFTPEAATDLLTQLGRTLGPRSRLLIGVDTTQDPALLIPAYDDAAGVTAEFNLNLLARINRELGGDFDRSNFRHLARPATGAHRDASGEPVRAGGACERTHLRLRDGRDDPYGELLQVFAVAIPAHGPRRALALRALVAGRRAHRLYRLPAASRSLKALAM